MVNTWQLFLFISVIIIAASESQEALADADELESIQSTSVDIIDNNVVGDKVLRFYQGGRAEIVWTTDKPLEIHLHGYDVELTLGVGNDNIMAFDLFAEGRFPVTVHAHSHSSASHERTLLYVEVHPR